MHALATAKAGSLGDERYISHSINAQLISERLNRPKWQFFTPLHNAIGVESLRSATHTDP